MESLIQLDRDAMNRLIGLLFKERLLWDKEHVAYAVPGEMKLAYQRISDAMAMRGLDAVRVWAVIKNIRLLYLKELKKIRIAADEIMMLATAAKVQGVVKPTPPMYVPTIWWFPMMEAMFEDKAIKCMNSASYSTMATTSYRSALNTMQQLYIHDGGITLDDDDDDDTDWRLNGGSKRLNPFQQQPDSQIKRPFYDLPKSLEGSASIQSIYSSQKSLMQNQPDQCNQPVRSKPLNMFFNYVFSAVESMPPRYALEVQKEINDVLVKYQIELINSSNEHGPALIDVEEQTIDDF